MAARTLRKPLFGVDQLVHRHVQGVAKAVKYLEASVIEDLGIRHLSDRLGTEAGASCQSRISQRHASASLVQIDAFTEVYRVVVSLFLPSIRYWGYPILSSLGAAPSCGGFALGTTATGFFPSGCHIRQSNERSSVSGLLPDERGGNRSIRRDGGATGVICASLTDFATRGQQPCGGAGQSRPPKSATLTPAGFERASCKTRGSSRASPIVWRVT